MTSPSVRVMLPLTHHWQICECRRQGARDHLGTANPRGRSCHGISDKQAAASGCGRNSQFNAVIAPGPLARPGGFYDLLLLRLSSGRVPLLRSGLWAQLLPLHSQRPGQTLLFHRPRRPLPCLSSQQAECCRSPWRRDWTEACSLATNSLTTKHGERQA